MSFKDGLHFQIEGCDMLLGVIGLSKGATAFLGFLASEQMIAWALVAESVVKPTRRTRMASA